MNDFARTQLMKYGWSEGKGLGKHESGITQALRPKFKFDTAGIGHNKNGDYNNWWENAFNKAANNISVKREMNGGVSISTSGKRQDDDNDTRNEPEEDKSKSSVRQYGNFLKSSVLLDGNLIEDVVSRKAEDVKEEDVSYTPLTDDELFRICGGRTGHKGARHGLTLNGKLKRISRQEEALLTTSSSSSEKLENNNNDNVSDAYERITDECTDIGDPEGVERKVSKTVKRNTRRCINLLSHKLNVVCNLSDDSGDAKGTNEMTEQGEPKRKKKKKRRVRSSDGCATTETKDVSRASSRKRSKKEMIKNNSEDCPSTSRSDTEYVTRTSAKKRKKLGKKKKQQEDEFNECPAKKFKKSDKDGMIDSPDVDLLGCRSQRENFLKQSTHDEINDDDLIRRMSTEADRSNRKLRKKKLAKRLRKERIRVENITKTLEAVHFNNRQQQQSEVVVVERRHKKRSQGTGSEKAIDIQTQCDG